MSIEQLSLPKQLLLHSLATRVPRIMLQRVDEISPVLKKRTIIMGEEMDVPPRAQVQVSSETMKNDCAYKKNISVEQYSCENSSAKYVNLGGCKNKRLRKDRYVCKVCMKSFKWPILLNRHIKDHTAPHMCPQCLKAFSLYSDLKNHQCVPACNFSCGSCNTTFAQENNLQKHQFLKNVTNKTNSCNIYKKLVGENT